MQFSTGHAEVQAEGFSQTANFTIAASGKAFKGLIDGLYSRKVEAIVRELATNAFDGHKAAENVAPFHVHLPTPLQPTFWIRDYGTGMSHALMMHRYTTMFDSTKDGLNEADSGITPDDQVGMLGLGSKSFFAYTDTCTITNWQAGEVRHYTVYMGADGIPAIAYAGAQPSDEADGVKVEFAVKTKDFKEFETAATRVFKGFPQIPLGLPIKVKEAVETLPSDTGSFWASYHDGYLPGSGFYARQGCVLYPIDLAQIDDHAVEEEEQVWDYQMQQHTTKTKAVLSENFAQFDKLKATIVIDFPIGSLEFDLSRERLAYNDKTVLSLRKRWQEFRDDIDSVLAQTFDPLPTGWQRFGAALETELTKLGKLTETSRYFQDSKRLWDELKDEVAAKRKDRTGKTMIRSLVGLPRKEGFTNRIAYARGDSGWPADSCTDRGKAVFIYVDDKAASLNVRILQYLRANGLVFAYIIETGRLTADRFKKMGCPPIVRSSQLPPAPKRAGGYYGNYEAPPPFERIKIIDRLGQTYDGAKNEEDYEGHLFCFINRGQVYNPDPEKYPNLNLSQVMEMHAALRYFTGQSISLINVKSNEYSKLDRWADYPLFYGCLDGILDTIDPKDLRDLTNIINYQRYEGTKYEVAAKRWVAAFPKAKDPLADMRRYKWRFERIEAGRRLLLGRFIQGTVMKPLVDQIIDRAHEAGREVLPFMQNASYQKPEIYPYHLLPKQWEKLMRAVFSQTVHAKNAPLFYGAVKEKLGC